MTTTALPSGLFYCTKGYPRICGGRSWTDPYRSPEPGVCITCYRKNHPLPKPVEKRGRFKMILTKLKLVP